jgi:dihydropteroate synthase
MSARLRVVPAAPSQLAADIEAPATLFIEAGQDARDQVAIATSSIGLGIDLSGKLVRVVASRRQMERLCLALRERDPDLATALAHYLWPVTAWQLRTRSLPLDRAHVMGIVNLTNDSFSGDGVGADIDAALRRAHELRAAGATIVDLGAESARADRPAMAPEAEAKLVAAAVKALAGDGHCVSIDTYKQPVAEAAIEAGAEIVNDISGLTNGTGAATAAIAARAGYVLNYSYSVPKRRPDSPPVYGDVVADTVAWMAERIRQLTSAGMERARLAIDPGIAFGKSHDEDVQVLRRIGELTTFGLPVLLAHSRKNFIGSINGQAPSGRDLETQVLSALAYGQGVRIFRVHDVAGTRRAVEMAAALVSDRPGAFAPDGESWPWRSGAAAPHMVQGDAQGDAPVGQRW